MLLRYLNLGDGLLPERRICTCSVDRRGTVSFHPALSFREVPWERTYRVWVKRIEPFELTAEVAWAT